jgi:hypothetical protein
MKRLSLGQKSFSRNLEKKKEDFFSRVSEFAKSSLPHLLGFQFNAAKLEP